MQKIITKKDLEPPDLVNLSYGTIKYNSDWHDDFLILI